MYVSQLTMRHREPDFELGARFIDFSTVETKANLPLQLAVRLQDASLRPHHGVGRRL